MVSKLEILCIKKEDRTNPHESIQLIGGKNPDGTRWSLTQKDAIKGIEEGKWKFYVNQAGKSVDVIVETSQAGNKYIKTIADDIHPNNLLSLSECS